MAPHSETGVSVILPVRNGEAFLAEAITSILTQTERDLELIVVDDASTDGTPQLLASLVDSRLRVIRNEQRRGIAGSCNRGIAVARGEYVARMDADDIALPHRLATQRAFLEAHREIALCGTWVRMFRGDWTRDRRLEADPERMRCTLFLYNTLSHPTAMWRRREFPLAYDETFENSEDYDLWSRASHCAGIANVPEILLLYRVHDAQAGKDREVRCREGRRVRDMQLARLGVQLEADMRELHEAICWGTAAATTRWLETLLAANERSRVYDPRVLETVLREQLAQTPRP
ncbi:MAG TPA: glycosyltransferase [Thermoanaerobaculia bacterium]|jgi:glycosyltransferase involved in cell wall biosynthesis